MKRLMIGVVIGAAVVAGAILAYRHFVTDRVTDKGGMENPFLTEFPQDAALLELDWTQNAMNGDDCFTLSLRREDGRCFASCDLAQGGGERLQREDAPLTAESWTAVEQCLKSEPHVTAAAVDDTVVISDDTVARLTVTWETPEGETGSEEYETGGEEVLAALLRDILTQTSDEYAPN